jgi:hypothetical protein
MYNSSASKVDKMKTVQKELTAREQKPVGALATSRCTHFLIGWIKRFGSQ